MLIKWSSQRAIANSRIVKTSVIWLVIVPFAAKLLSSIDDVVNLTVFGASVSITTILPFSWQLLFFTSIFFSIAGLVYSIFCPVLVKKYESFTQFESDGKSRLQVNAALKEITWDKSTCKLKNNYIEDSRKYFTSYSDQYLPSLSDDELNARVCRLFDNVSVNEGKNSNAFYFVYSLSDTYGQKAIWFSLVFYMTGFACIGVIALQNICYVVKTFF